MPHTLFYGPPGAGKTTLMKATLRELYGPGVERVKVETTPWKVATPSRTVDVELTTLASNYHVELTPADAGNMDRYEERRTSQRVVWGVSGQGSVCAAFCHAFAFAPQSWLPSAPGPHDPPGSQPSLPPDALTHTHARRSHNPTKLRRYVVQEIIKEMAKSRPVDLMPGAASAGAAAAAGAATTARPTFKVLVLHEVDRLTRDAQAALRRTMERYAAGCRLVMTAASLSRVIEPLRSRCLCVRVPAPTPADLVSLLAGVAKKEGLALPDDLADRVAAASGRSARRALLCLEACRAAAYPFTPGQPVERPDWEAYAAEIAASSLADPSPKALYIARGQVYELLVNCIPPEVVLRTLAAEVRGALGTGAVVVVGAANDGKAQLIGTVSADLVARGVSARSVLADAAKEVGGGAGGGDDLAQAGGRDASRLDEALGIAASAARDAVRGAGGA
jgi:DNA polymerase III delta prime subunit